MEEVLRSNPNTPPRRKPVCDSLSAYVSLLPPLCVVYPLLLAWQSDEFAMITPLLSAQSDHKGRLHPPHPQLTGDPHPSSAPTQP